MIKRLFICALLVPLIICISSCERQAKKSQSKKAEEKSKVTPANNLPKLKQTLGSQASDNINSSLQDKGGNLWFGSTGEGVYKFDGKKFTQFTTRNGLASNRVYCIFEDNEDKIWVGTEAGICVYNGVSFAKIEITSETYIASSSPDVFNIMQDSAGKLWLATVDGVYTYDGKTFTHFPINESGKGFMSDTNNVEYILEVNEGNIWFGGRVNDGVYRYDGNSIVNFPLKELNGHRWAWPLLQDKNGSIWFSNWGGVYRYNGKTFKSFVEFDGLCFDTITRIIEDKNGNIWFGGNGGICRYDGQYFTYFTIRDGLNNQAVWSILEDIDGDFWIGTRSTGLFRFDGKTFTSFSD
ncbi:two-component regulator propeller domain-containing protein [Ekhidna sp.]|uniref:ligand-binding sensor domain-containing protein n=1 Tax=Ekhidna sp. TaxID=2608089 RepID=UPI003299F6B9